MSKFSVFMKANKRASENEKYAPTASLIESDGTPVKFEFRHITSKENEVLRDACTFDVPITGKPNLFRPKLNTSKYLAQMIVKACVFPDLYDKELQDSYGVMNPEDLMLAMVDNAGEYQDLCTWMQKFQGFSKSLDEKVDEAKNS